MRRSKTKYFLTAGLLTLGTLAFTPSCATNDSSMFIVGVIDIDLSTCIAKPDTTSSLLTAGTLDTAFKKDYTAILLVGNQLTAQGSREQLRTETSRVSLRGAEVTLTTVSGGALKDPTTGKTVPSTFSTIGTGFVDPAAGDAASYAAVAVNIIPASLSTNISGQVLAKIRVFGDSLGGKSVTSSELDFPITICQGCLVTYPAQGDPTSSTYMCPTPSATGATATTAGPCVQGQDIPFSCTLCSGAYDVCKDPLKNPAYTPAATP